MRILLVEDNADLRVASGGLLEGRGHAVTSVESAEAALEALAEPAEPFDAVVSDVDLPGMSGAELLRRLVGGPLDLVAASSRAGAVPGLRRSDPVARLEKPYSSAALAAALDEARRLRQARDPRQKSGSDLETRETDSWKAADPAVSLAVSPAADQPVPGAGGRPKAWAAAAALALALVGGTAVWNLTSGPPPLPEAPTSGVVRGGSIALSEPLGEVLDLPSSFRWSEAEGAREYRIRLRTVDGSTLWEGTSAVPSASLSQEVANLLERAVVYYWQVWALDGEGRVLARSPEERFLLKPGGAS